MEITWKDSDDLCLDLMPTIWVLNWAQKEGVPGPHAPTPAARGQAEHQDGPSFPTTHENHPNGIPQWTEG